MIVLAIVDGWQVVVKKGEFSVGDYCVFFEIDSFLPAQDPRFAFLAKSGVKTDEHGVERIRLRSIKLRKQLSQGLALPVNMFNAAFEEIDAADGNHPDSYTSEARDKLLAVLEDDRHGIEAFLNVTKYERPDERNGGTGAGSAKTAGNFPITIPKTDEPRVQNVFGKFSQTMKGVKFRKSLKLDGSSQTIAYFNNPDFFIEKVDDEVLGWDEELQELKVLETKPYPFQWQDSQVIVCSRNLALKFDEGSAFWKAARKDDIPARLKQYGEDNNRQLALQGEMCGPGCQGNSLGLTEPQFYCFRIWDIDKNEFLSDAEFIEVTSHLGIEVVPQFDVADVFEKYSTIKDILEAAPLKNPNGTIAEGIVFKSTTKVNGETVHFKVINNKWLLGVED